MKYSSPLYAKALYEVLRAGTDDEYAMYIRRFLHILKRQNQFKLLPKILREVKRLEEGGAAHVKSAARVPDSTMHALKELLGVDRIGQEVEPELFGGAVIAWDDWRLDASVRGQLAQLKN